MSKISQSFGINSSKLRTRQFEINGQKFNVRIPLATEAEEMYKKCENPDEQAIEAKYKEITKTLYEKKEELQGLDSGIEFKDNDIVVGESSMRQMAKSQISTEIRILESFKLLVPVDNTDLSNLTYEEINEEFPLPIQLVVVKKIAEVISPNYEETRKN